LITFGPLALAVGLFGIAYYVAGIVFAIKATITGLDTYDVDPACQHRVGKWLLVYGCLGILATLMSCCGRSTRVKPDGTLGQGGASPIESLAVFAQFSWLIYGLTILFRREDDLKPCNEAQWELFSLIVKFMFYGMLALFATGALLFCIGVPVFFGLVEELARFSDEERPILTESMLESGTRHHSPTVRLDSANAARATVTVINDDENIQGLSVRKS
jgi:hypothetical protein